MTHLTRYHPVLWFGLLSLAAFFVSGAIGPTYDTGGLKTILFFIGYLLSFVFRWIGYLLTSMNGGQPMRYQLGLTVVLGMALFYAVDRAVTAIGRR